RRRHTRFDCDWSSDVCSSDLSGRRMTTALVVSRYFPNDSRTVGVHQRLGTQVQALATVVDRVDCLFLQPVERHYAAAELREHEQRLRRLWSAAVWIRVAPTLVDDEPPTLWQRRGRGV